MDQHSEIIYELERNGEVYSMLLCGVPKEQYLWKPAPEKWCLLEIVCHLFDEEKEDFRSWIKHVLNTPDLPLAQIDPQKWVKERKYMKQNYEDTLDLFIKERTKSIVWLQALKKPPWKNAYKHQKFGSMSAEMFLANWLAHDYLHFRQIISLRFGWLKESSGEDLSYAGNW